MASAAELYGEAEKLKNSGQFEPAVAKLHEVLTADPNYAIAHAALSVVLQRLGRHDEALAHAHSVCELQPQDPFSFTALSVTYQRAFAGTGNQQYIRMAEDAMERSRMMQMGHR